MEFDVFIGGNELYCIVMAIECQALDFMENGMVHAPAASSNARFLYTRHLHTKLEDHENNCLFCYLFFFFFFFFFLNEVNHTCKDHATFLDD